MNGNQKILVLLIGPPGCGKGTQAELLSQSLGLFHLETSQIIEDKFKNAEPDDEIINRQKEIWQTGELMDSALIEGWIMARMTEVIGYSAGVVTSGSPRTLQEAEGELPKFEKIFGKKNIFPINIQLSRVESFNRNSHRRICKMNRHPIPNFKEYENITTCPKDGSELIIRKELDDPETIGVRYEVYLKRTEPLWMYFKMKGYHIIEINGEQSIESVHADILKAIEKYSVN